MAGAVRSESEPARQLGNFARAVACSHWVTVRMEPNNPVLQLDICLDDAPEHLSRDPRRNSWHSLQVVALLLSYRVERWLE